ncbi:hypothetical protein E4N62_46690 [Streptomyces sp. MNU76]|uniref:hypothetical protein n=1 Tax=Streptomyces sp. MNU76 TaxID=2560026 RepID=UPI001E55C16B|nr:hypothetical protein [Streptomyces sp. MNU76]MCC9712045.1 hypothetical protein [Streptomyces sp. MNU76]
MNLDASLFIAVLLGCIAAAVLIGSLIFARHARYQGRTPEPYAGFRTGARHTGTGEFLQLACEGHCPGTTAHEITGDEDATCVLCGTHRSTLPDFAQADDQA